MKDTYKLKHALRDFRLSELTDGAEAGLTEPLHMQIQKQQNQVTISSEIRKSTDIYPTHTEILLDEEWGDLIEMQCSCRNFVNNGYTCEHVQTLLIQYLMKRDGIDSFKGTVIERELIRKTGIQTPFLPGILRRTDAALKVMLQQNQKERKKADRPIWQISPMEMPAIRCNGTENKRNTGNKGNTGNTRNGSGRNAAGKSAKNHLQQHIPISVECIIHPRNGRMALEIKAGPKRHYVIRKINSLLDAYISNTEYAFSSSNTIPAGRDHYETESARIMDFLSEIYINAKYSDQEMFCFFRSGYGNELREMFLSGRDMDAFMNQMEGKELLVSSSKGDEKCRVMLEQKTAPISLVKEEYGAQVTIPAVILLGCGIEGMYLAQHGKIMRLPADQWKHYKKLENLSKNAETMYLQDRDIADFCHGLQDMNLNADQIVAEGFEMTAYLPENPQIRIYLDYPQEFWISCKIMAWYESAEREYSVFDRKKGTRARNFEKEQRAAEAIWGYFSSYDDNAGELFLECDEDQLYDFLTETIPQLAKQGEILISDQLKKLRVRKAGDITVGIQVDAGNLLMSLHSNTMNKEEMMEILSRYRKKRRFTRLKNGEFVVMDNQFEDTWETLAETFRNYGKKNPEAMKVPLYRALYLEESLKNRDEICFQESENYLQLLDRVRDEEMRNYQVPDSLKDILRPYQAAGYRWLRMLKDNGFGGILADDMGLGKTIQVLAFLLAEKENHAEKKTPLTLITAPASLIYNWKREIEVFAPALNSCIIAGTLTERRNILRNINRNEPAVYITSYDLLKRDISEYEEIHFDCHIVDEAQFIKNQNTQAAKSVRLVNSSFRAALTGTPIENRLSDLWSIFDFLMPGFLYSYTRFRAEYEAPVVQNQDKETMNRLRRMVHPFILRRLKKDVLKDLPDKLEETITICMEKEQRKIYDAYAERLRLYLDKQSDEEFHQSKLEILAELTKLRQICCGPELFLEDYWGANCKKEAALELIRQAVDGGHKVLLFSQFTNVLDELCAGLKENKTGYHRLDGSTPKEKRMEMVTSFETDDVPVFCISLKAGGTGLNLTAADIVIHYDPWWNLAAQNQATDRAHRIGQTNTVTVYQLIVEKTIEEQIVNLQKTKAQLAEDILSGEGISSILIDKENLMELLC